MCAQRHTCSRLRDGFPRSIRLRDYRGQERQQRGDRRSPQNAGGTRRSLPPVEDTEAQRTAERVPGHQEPQLQPLAHSPPTSGPALGHLSTKNSTHMLSHPSTGSQDRCWAEHFFQTLRSRSHFILTTAPWRKVLLLPPVRGRMRESKTAEPRAPAINQSRPCLGHCPALSPSPHRFLGERALQL